MYIKYDYFGLPEAINNAITTSWYKNKITNFVREQDNTN